MSDSKKPNIIHGHLNRNDGYTTTVSGGKHELVADEPESVPGGTHKGPDPYDLLLMSYSACTLMTLKMYADRKGWEFDDIYVEMRHEKKHVDDCQSCEKPKAHLDFIEKEIIIKGDLTDEQKERMLQIADKCPVHKTLSQGVRVTSMLG